MSLIKIIPLQFAAIDELEKMLALLSERFKMEAVINTPHFDLTPYFNPVRSQYNANEIIQKLVPLTGERDKIVGITGLDLFIPVLSYIFGQAYLGGSVALVSGHRLENSRY